MSDPHDSVQKIRSVQRVSLYGPESGVADAAAKLFFCRAVGHAGGAHDVHIEQHLF